MKRLLLFFFYIVTVDMTDGNMRQLAIEKTSVSSYTVLSVFWQNKETEKRLRNTVFGNEKFYSSTVTISFKKPRAVISSKYDKKN